MTNKPQMKAVAFQQSHPVTHPEALLDVHTDKPVASGRDILVRVEAVSVNPVDTKIRLNAAPETGQMKIPGWDAAGVVDSAGDEVTLFSPGDQVWYAGAIDRQGTNAEYHLVDERLVAKMPKTLDFTQAAAMPLTSITAWEILFDRLKVVTDKPGTLLIIGGAGGVGSMMIQLAKQRTQLTVIASASRPETREWVTGLGADIVVNHKNSLTEEINGAGIQQVDYIASLTNTDKHLDDINNIIKPQGSFAVIDDMDVLDIMPFKRKSISIHWELMFTRSLFQTDDMIEQHRILEKVAAMVDEGKLKTTLTECYGVINAQNMIRAHQLIESGKSRGKIVLAGFG